MRIQYRPIESWPGDLTPDNLRDPSPFDSTWGSTLGILERETRMLGADVVVVELPVRESDLYVDGTGLKTGRKPQHPGAIVSFKAHRHGPLRYACDRFVSRSYNVTVDAWQINVRAIALGLEALRKVERYGIATRGEQYAGWKQLGTGLAMPPVRMTPEDAALLLAGSSGLVDKLLAGDADCIHALWREQARRHHPDLGGEAAMFRRITEARDVLLEQA